MAFISQFDEEEQKKQQGEQPSLGEGAQLSSGSGLASGGAGAAGQAPLASGTGGQNKFVNIQEYLRANKGSSGAGLLEQEIDPLISKEKERLGSEASKYESGLKSSYDPYLSKLSTAGGTASGLGSDVTSYIEGRQKGAQKIPLTSFSPTLQGIQSALNLQGPQSSPFSFQQAESVSQPLQKVKQADVGYLSELYRKQNPLIGSGALALQKQLDLQSEKLPQVQESVRKKGENLSSDISKESGRLSGIESALKSQAQQKRDYLSGVLSGQGQKAQEFVDAIESGRPNLGGKSYIDRLQESYNYYNTPQRPSGVYGGVYNPSYWLKEIANLRSGYGV